MLALILTYVLATSAPSSAPIIPRVWVDTSANVFHAPTCKLAKPDKMTRIARTVAKMQGIPQSPECAETDAQAREAWRKIVAADPSAAIAGRFTESSGSGRGSEVAGVRAGRIQSGPPTTRARGTNVERVHGSDRLRRCAAHRGGAMRCGLAQRPGHAATLCPPADGGHSRASPKERIALESEQADRLREAVAGRLPDAGLLREPLTSDLEPEVLPSCASSAVGPAALHLQHAGARRHSSSVGGHEHARRPSSGQSSLPDPGRVRLSSRG
jgi:hypothetical protein